MLVRAIRVAAAVAALALLVSSCADDDPPPQATPPTPSAPATSAPTSEPSEPSEPVEPTLPAAANANSEGGAEEFVRHFWNVANYAQASGDTDSLASLSNKLCEACNAAITSLRAVFKADGSVEGGIATVSDFKTESLQAGDDRLFRVTFTLSTTRQVIDMPGVSKDRVFPAASARDRFVVDRQDGRWLVGIWEVLS